MSNLSQDAMQQLFSDARTHSHWQPRSIEDSLLQALYEQAKWGPTSMNCQPMRLVFVKSPEAKEKLKQALAPGNVDKTMNAPVTVIVATDMTFYEGMPRLFPANANARDMFANNTALAEATALRNATLQGGYLILAARALGLDCGPMSGFNTDLVNDLFFAGTTIKANFLVNLGYGLSDKVYPRGPRYDFDEACTIT